MNKNSTLKGKFILILAIFTLLSAFSANAGGGKGKAPKFNFNNPKLIAGTDGQIGAKYLFKDVYNKKDAVITIENIVGGAVLKDIDNTSTGYPEAWQPTVGGPGTFGISYIKWDVEFDSAGVPYVFSLLDLSAADVDGDNVRVREISGIVGSNINYDMPDSLIPSLLTINRLKDIDNTWGTDDDDSVFLAIGPVANRVGIDTFALDVRIDYTFSDRSSFQIYTGSQVDNNGSTGPIATDRFHSIYFGDLFGLYKVLEVKYQNFNAVLNNNAINLNWSMSGEVEGSYFEVERSFDQVNFSTTGIIMDAQSVNNGTAKYAFTDLSKEILNHNKVYYRLKQINSDAKISYSEIKVVRIAEANFQKATVQIMPNPYMDKLNVKFESNAAGNGEIRLISSTGVMVKKTSASITKGYNSIGLEDLSNQPKGMYIVDVVVNGTSLVSQKVIKN